MNKRGLLITFEGIEGAGKTEQVKRLEKRLKKMGKEVLVVREPGGTTIGEQIREVVLTSKNLGISKETETLLFQAARAQLYREVIKPALEKGMVVLADRGPDSSLVYQSSLRGIDVQFVKTANAFSTLGLKPDLTFVLDVPAEVGLMRKKLDGEENRFEKEDIHFHTKARKAYLDLVEKENHRFRVIDATQEVQVVERKIWREVEVLFS